MLDIHKLFAALDDNDKKVLYRLSKGWYEKLLESKDIVLAMAEYDMLHGHGNVAKTVTMIRSRLNCSMVVAKAACDREVSKKITQRYEVNKEEPKVSTTKYPDSFPPDFGTG